MRHQLLLGCLTVGLWAAFGYGQAPEKPAPPKKDTIRGFGRAVSEPGAHPKWEYLVQTRGEITKLKDDFPAGLNQLGAEG